MVWVVYPLFLVSIGASKAWIAIFSAINTGGQAIAMMFVDKLKESLIFAFGLVLSLIAFVAYSQLNNYLQVIPVQLVISLAWACLYVGALLLLLRSNEEKATSTGLLFSTINLSGAAGPFLGGIVAQVWGYRPLMYIASGFCLTALILRLAGVASAKKLEEIKVNRF